MGQSHVKNRGEIAIAMAEAISHRRTLTEPRAAPLPSRAAHRSLTTERDTRSVLAFVWDRFGPYHVDRLEAVARTVADRYETVGVEIASFDHIYSWDKSRRGDGFRQITLFPDRRRLDIGKMRCFLRLMRVCISTRARIIFVCNYEDPVVFFTSLCMRILGRAVVVMQDSKFDDKQRWLKWEILKSALYLPYNAALVGSARTASYLEFLGLPRDRIVVGYDTVSVERIRGLAASAPAPDGIPHEDRHFTIIARFVPKKNLAMALDAYAFYVAVAESRGVRPRELRICGSGELEQELRDRASELGLTGVVFLGFLQEDGVARQLASSLALLLPSVEEQYGLVVNEAVAMGVPVALSDNCGARDVLVRTGVNGFVFEPDNPEGLARWMDLVDRDPEEWARLARGNHRVAASGDTPRFASAVEAMIEACYPAGARINGRAR